MSVDSEYQKKREAELSGAEVLSDTDRQYETQGHPVVPSVIIKWYGMAAPYVEIRHDSELLVAGWVHPTPDGPIKRVDTQPNPVIPK